MMPTLGQPVVLRDGGGFDYASRVEDLDEASMVVARPADLRAGLEYPIGMELDVLWTLSTGIHVLPTTLTSTSLQRNLRLWHLAVRGDSWTEQRRDYVRVPVLARITVRRTAGDGERALAVQDRRAPDGAGFAAAQADTVPGQPEEPDEDESIVGSLADLSEVAVRCLLPVPSDDRRIAKGRVLHCSFSLADDDFDLNGLVLITRPGNSSQDSAVVIHFGHSELASDALRRHVFRIQLERRRQGEL